MEALLAACRQVHAALTLLPSYHRQQSRQHARYALVLSPAQGLTASHRAAIVYAQGECESNRVYMLGAEGQEDGWCRAACGACKAPEPDPHGLSGAPPPVFFKRCCGLTACCALQPGAMAAWQGKAWPPAPRILFLFQQSTTRRYVHSNLLEPALVRAPAHLCCSAERMLRMEQRADPPACGPAAYPFAAVEFTLRCPACHPCRAGCSGDGARAVQPDGCPAVDRLRVLQGMQVGGGRGQRRPAGKSQEGARRVPPCEGHLCTAYALKL